MRYRVRRVWAWEETLDVEAEDPRAAALAALRSDEAWDEGDGALAFPIRLAVEEVNATHPYDLREIASYDYRYQPRRGYGDLDP